MRILQVTPRYLPNTGGIEVFVQKVSESLVDKGIEVVVYSVDMCSNLARIETIRGVRVKRFFPLFSDPLFLPEPKFIYCMRKEKVDIIHVHNIHTLPPLVSALFKRNNQKLVLQPHYHRYGQSILRNSFLELYKKTAYKTLFSRTNCIVTNSIYEKQALCKDFPDANNVLLLPEGIDVDEAVAVKREPVEPKRVLYVGALKEYKKVDKVLEGFSSLIKNGNNNFRLIIVGDGPERQKLVNLATVLGISKLVEWKSDLSRQQLLAEYAAASVLIMLSPLESFSRGCLRCFAYRGACGCFELWGFQVSS